MISHPQYSSFPPFSLTLVRYEVMGRPKIEFDREAIANCVKQGFNWKEIARVLGYSYSTLMGWKETQD